MILTQDLGYSEITEFVSELNHILDKHKTLEQEYKEMDIRFKELITNISHDIRTPLTSLDGYFQLLTTCESEEDRNRYMEIIRNRLEILQAMLEQMFTYMKLQNNSYELPLEPCDLNPIVCSTILSLYSEFQDRNIEPDIQVPEEPLIVAAGNPLAFSRVIQNIVKNALEHGSNRFFLHLSSIDDRIIISCGNQMNSAAQLDCQKVFTRFYKADSSRNHSSTGLGLAITKEFVEKMHGEISAEQKEDMFLITIVFSSHHAACDTPYSIDQAK